MIRQWLSVAVPMLTFAGFVVLALLVRKGDRPGGSAPLRVFILYVIAVSTCVGFSRKDMWPFAAWRYVSYAIGQEGSFLVLVGVDENGREHQLDTRTFEPLEFANVMGDLDYNINSMSPTHRSELLGFLLRLTQDGLARVQVGRPVGRFARLLGPFSAPVFHVPVTWSDPKKLPHEIDELRVYQIYWRASGETAQIEKQVLVASTKP